MHPRARSSRVRTESNLDRQGNVIKPIVYDVNSAQVGVGEL